MNKPSPASELLFGHKAIGSALGMTARQALYHDEQGRLPTFRMGRRVVARRAALTAWALEQEAKARGDGA